GAQRLAGLGVPYELQPPEQAESPDLADAGVVLREGRELLAQVVAHCSRVLDDALLAERLDRRDADRAGERVAGVRQPTGEEPVLDRVVDMVADGHRAERNVPRVDSLRGRDDVGDDVPVVAAEP